jgi:hypothetical protein
MSNALISEFTDLVAGGEDVALRLGLERALLLLYHERRWRGAAHSAPWRQVRSFLEQLARVPVEAHPAFAGTAVIDAAVIDAPAGGDTPEA